MESTSMDHYEKQLYSVFKTFDVDNEEALDRSAVLDLCDALQLEDRGAALVETLFERPAERVTFTQFRNGLLSVLGAAPCPVANAAEDESREVAPKFVVGTKKYGRRSRPSEPERTDSRNSETDSEKVRRRMKTKKASTAMELSDGNGNTSRPENDLDHDKRIDYEESLELCRNLNMDCVDRHLVERIFQDAASDEITVGEFFDRLNASLTISIASTCDVASAGGEPSSGPTSAFSADTVVEAWERAGVEHGRQLLQELGFPSPSVKASELSRALDVELRALGAQPEPRALLLQAALALQRLRLTRELQLSDAARAENTKLRADLADANKRAQTLAQEVDENHARIEATLKGKIKLLEAKHAEELRVKTSELSGEREKAVALSALLETSSAKFSAEETKLRANIASLHKQNNELSRRASLAEEHVSELQAARDVLMGRLNKLEQAAQVQIQRNNGQEDELALRIEQLQNENKLLRDRNDELCGELDARPRPTPPRLTPLPLLSHDSTDELDHSLITLDQGLLSDMESVRGMRALLAESRPRLVDSSAQTDPEDHGLIQQLKKQLIEVQEKHSEEKQKLSNLVKEMETSLEQMKSEYEKCEDYWSSKMDEEREIYSEEQRASDERLAELIDKIAEYERQFAPARGHALPAIDERTALEAQVNDLDDEYRKYRAAAEAELAARDQQLSALKERVSGLEAARADRRDYLNPAFGPRGGDAARAPRSASADGLDAPAVHCVSCRSLQSRCRQMAAALRHHQMCLEAVQQAARVEGAELRARIGRAEGAAGRLRDRLAAADLLVKDLYLENCQLAHHGRRP